MASLTQRVASPVSLRNGVRCVPVNGTAVEDVLLAVGEEIGFENISSASRMNKAVVVFVKEENQVSRLISNGIVKFLLHRLVVVARLQHGLADRHTVGDYYERFVYSQQRTRAGEDVTGLLLLYPEHALHVLECSTEVLLSVMQDLTHMQKNPDSAVLLTPRVLLVSHDISSRFFQQWSFTLLKESRLTTSSEENCETLVVQTLHQLLQLGSHLLTAGEKIKECKEIPEEVLQSQLIPAQTVVSHLIHMEALLSPVQYLNTNHSPLHLLLDSESVWPAVEDSSDSQKG